MMDKSQKGKALMIFLGKHKPGKGKGMFGKDEDSDKDYEDEEMDESEEYKSYGEDLLSAIKSEDPEKVGRAICDIIESKSS